jgi:hypothetical protein
VPEMVIAEPPAANVCVPMTRESDVGLEESLLVMTTRLFPSVVSKYAVPGIVIGWPARLNHVVPTTKTDAESPGMVAAPIVMIGVDTGPEASLLVMTTRFVPSEVSEYAVSAIVTGGPPGLRDVVPKTKTAAEFPVTVEAPTVITRSWVCVGGSAGRPFVAGPLAAVDVVDLGSPVFVAVPGDGVAPAAAPPLELLGVTCGTLGGSLVLAAAGGARRPWPGVRAYGGSHNPFMNGWQLSHPGSSVYSLVGTESIGEH